MSEMIWCWRKGNKSIYTKSFDIAVKALKDGFQVNVVKNPNRIFRH
jgi:hypothetical protein